jgi:mono/diheme cytochrome c family protein
MRRYELISLVALLALVAALPIYMVRESDRMARGQAAMRQQFVADGAVLYVENCVLCHGTSGEGIGAMPALNTLSSAEYNVLYRTIAHAPHGSAMASWHVDEGGPLNNYQVEGLVTLIQNADWPRVSDLASRQGVTPPAPAALKADIAALEGTGEDPHECRACHEEPEVHADRFGLNCARCHTLQAWKPALLTRHTFLLDHGDEGQVACQTCHTASYSGYTCYECHDHTPEGMADVHTQEGIYELEPCAGCHPTGRPGEGEIYRDSYEHRQQAGAASDERAHAGTELQIEGDELVVEISQSNPGQ